MNFERLKDELELAVQDTSLHTYFDDWINDAVKEIAHDFELPALKLKSPTTLATTESNWLYDMPSTYHKKVFKCRNSEGYSIQVYDDIEEIEVIDYSHADTGADVTNIAVEDGQIAIYPKAVDTLSLWFYRLPVDMTQDDDEPDGIPTAYAERVIIPKVLVKNYRLLTDMTMQNPHRSIEYWDNRYKEGLYGTPGGDIGMIHYFAKLKGVKVGSGSRGRYI